MCNNFSPNTSYIIKEFAYINIQIRKFTHGDKDTKL